MKKISRILAAVFSFLFLLASCSSSPIRLTYEDGRLVHSGKKLSYQAAPLNYEPVAIGEEYAVYGKANFPLYEIVGLDPKEWLTEANSGATTTVFYGEGVTLPTLREMDPTELYVCVNGLITFADRVVTDKHAIDRMIDLFENGEQVTWPLSGSIRTYELKFHSPERWPRIYYNLTFGEFPEGMFLYDRTTKRCVEIGDLLDKAESR